MSSRFGAAGDGWDGFGAMDFGPAPGRPTGITNRASVRRNCVRGRYEQSAAPVIAGA